MTKIYACLIGNWVCLSDDPDCRMGRNLEHPSLWFNNDSNINALTKRYEDDSFSELDSIRIIYKDVTYTINPIFIQLVSY